MDVVILGLFGGIFLSWEFCLVIGLHGMHPSSVGLEFKRCGVCNLGHGLSMFVGVTALVVECH